MKIHKSRNSAACNKWRKNVLERDKYQCQKCMSKDKLHVHHIIKWEDNVMLRYEVNNGITLCSTCHSREHKLGKPNYKLRGRKLSPEHIEKMREQKKGNKNMLGKTHSEESKIKMSLAKIGKLPWSTGKKFTDEHIEKLRQAKLGKKGSPRTEEWKRKISESHKGRIVKESTKEILRSLKINKTWIINEITGKREWIDKNLIGDNKSD